MSSKKIMLPKVKKGGLRILDVNREPGRPKKRKKIIITFDENKRKEFLTGAHKRNLEKRAKAKERLKEKMKAEKKRITEEAKAQFNSYLSQRDIPELEEMLAKHEYEMEGKTVSILELNVKELTNSANWIGDNRPSYEQEEPQIGEIDDAEEDDENMVPGMELEEKKVKEQPQQKNINQPQFSQKDIAKAIMRKTHKSKLFKKKQEYESSRNKKRAAREKKKQERMLKNAKGKTKIKLQRQIMKNNNDKSCNKKSKK